MRAVKYVREEQLLGAARGPEIGYGLFEVRMDAVELDRLQEELEERTQALESLKEQQDDLRRNFEKTLASQRSYDVFLKSEENNKAAQKAEREREEVLQREVEMKRLQKEYSEMMEKKQEMLRQVQRYSIYKDFMDDVCRITKFKDADVLMEHVDRLLHVKQQLWEKASETQEKVDQQRKAAAVLEDQRNSFILQKKNELSQLQRQLEKTCSEALKWEKKWNHIKETAAKKTLTLGQIKMATLNLYEMMGAVIGEEGVDMNHTERQLDQIKMYLEDHIDIMQQYGVRRSSNEKKGDKASKKSVK
ncbi:coiled-coil domain-containing protein 42 homolog [Salarias fasciatus]|uniref:coiled-coil domain-containing protein 42 homolog n=1 Tax=Salarias fasciatus TaxID=181472 RepID=UPI001176C012|nr:cilia- and flagella-associated protein 73 [Salarias fasciatus]